MHVSVQTELLAKNEQQVIEKDTGCEAMLRDHKLDDLSRLCRVFTRVPNGLNPISQLFRKHVEAEGMALVNEVTAAAAAKPDGVGLAKKEAVSAEQNFIRRVLALQVRRVPVPLGIWP